MTLRYWPSWPAAWATKGEFEDAIALLARAAEADPGNPVHHLNVSDMMLETDDLPGAIDAMERAMAIDGNGAGQWDELGLLCLEAGRSERAGECFRRALSLNALQPGVSLNLARSKRFSSEDDPDLPLLRGLIEAKRPDRGRALDAHWSDVHFALAKAEEDLGHFEPAFEHYVEANVLMKGALSDLGEGFDRAAHTAGVDKLIDAFDATLFERLSGVEDVGGKDSERPVLIVGMPRSGTSLVEQILASHLSVYGAGELSLLDGMSRTVRSRLRAGSNYPACIKSIDEGTVSQLRSDYIRELKMSAVPMPRVTDKMPSNFLHLGFAALIAPKASLIHVTRDPLDTCWSIYATQFGTGHEWAYDLDDIAFYYGEYRRLMAHWDAVLPVPVLTLQYEALVSDQERQSRALVAHCGLEWDERCLEFHNTQRRVETASEWQVRQPMYASSVARWRRYERQLETLRDALARLRAGQRARAGRRMSAKTKRKSAKARPAKRPDLLQRAVQSHGSGRLDDAERGYLRFLELNKDHPVALHNLGLLLNQSGRTEQAIDKLERAAELAPDDASIPSNLGNMLQAQGDLEGAEKQLSRGARNRSRSRQRKLQPCRRASGSRQTGRGHRSLSAAAGPHATRCWGVQQPWQRAAGKRPVHGSGGSAGAGVGDRASLSTGVTQPGDGAPQSR